VGRTLHSSELLRSKEAICFTTGDGLLTGGGESDTLHNRLDGLTGGGESDTLHNRLDGLTGGGESDTLHNRLDGPSMAGKLQDRPFKARFLPSTDGKLQDALSKAPSTDGKLQDALSKAVGEG